MNHLNNDKNDVEQLEKIRASYTTLVDYLKGLMFKEGILDSPTYADLSRKLGFRYNWIKEKKTTMNQGHFPKKKTFDDLYNRLSERFIEQLSKSYKTIQTGFNELYTLNFSTEIQSHTDLISNQKSIKREFFNHIKEIIQKYFPNARVFDTDLSRLLFTRARTLKDSHLKGDYKYRKLELSTLFSFIYKIRTITKEEFSKKITDINSVDEKILQKIKTKIENFIEEFMFANPFDVKYIGDSYNTGTRYFKPEYELTLKVWFEISKAKKEPILLKVARKILKYETFGRLNRFGEPNRGKVYSWIGLMNMLKELIKLVPYSSYSKIFKNTWDYINLRNLYLFLPRVYHPSWYTLSTIKFHVTMLILRDLGLDIINLEPFISESFKKTHKMESLTYERHHIFINDKMSIDVNRLALVMHKNHSDLEGKTELILNLIKSRIDLTFDCPQYYKTNLKDWRKQWQVYLERRNYLIENGIEKFIIEYFTDDSGHNYIIERFFKDTPKGKIEEAIRIGMQNWIAKNRPAPILNIAILNRLFDGTPHLIKSGHVRSKS